MATKFRTKGKGNDRKVYPVGNGRRKPYGIERSLAAEDVQRLRKQGKRTRLIETNKRLDLYSAFISDLPDQAETSAPSQSDSPAAISSTVHANPVEPAITSSSTTPPPQSNRNFVVSKEKTESIFSSLGILNDKGKLNELKRNYQQWFGEGEVKITVEDGRTELLAMDKKYIAMIRERFFTTLPDGKYTLKTDNEGIPQIVPLDDYDSRAARMKLPSLDYGINAGVISIQKDKLKEFISTVNQNSNEGSVFLFQSKEGRNGIDLIAKKEDIEGNNADKVIYHYDGQVPDNIRCSIDSGYMSSAIDTMLGRKRAKNPEGINDFLIKIKSDYPLEIGFTGTDNRGESVGYKAFVAPRIE